MSDPHQQTGSTQESDDTTPQPEESQGDPATIPSIDEIALAAPTSVRRPKRARKVASPSATDEAIEDIGFGLRAPVSEPDPFDDDLDGFEDEPPAVSSASAQAPLPAPIAAERAGSTFAAPLTALFYLLALREHGGPDAITLKKQENPYLYLACAWGDYAYRLLVIAAVLFVVVLLAIKVFT